MWVPALPENSATNSILWHIERYSHPINAAGRCLRWKNCAYLFNTLEDSGALPVEVDVSGLSTGMLIDLYPYGRNSQPSRSDAYYLIPPENRSLLDEVQAGAHPIDHWSQFNGRARAF
jgi:aconitate hydratase 2/2-methylisocitrate dehydratase